MAKVIVTVVIETTHDVEILEIAIRDVLPKIMFTGEEILSVTVEEA